VATLSLRETAVARESSGHIGEDSLSALLDDRDFQAIHSRMSRFNLFEAVGAIRGELRHSNFLAYLLSPGRSHGFGARPLVSVLRAILEGMNSGERPIMTLELMIGDPGDAIVYRERDNLDLLIEVSSLKLVVLIENKIDAKAADGQLERYRSIIETRYPDHKKLYVFLTPNGLDPKHSAYVPFSYTQLAKVLDDLANERFGTSESTLIVRHYVEMLRRHIVPDERLRELAAQLYERHSEALEFIWECRPQQGGLLEALQDRIEGVSGLTIDSSGANILRFVPDAWDQSLKSIQCDPTLWTRTGRALLFEVKTFTKSPGRINLSLLIGPAAAESRAAFYEAARAQPQAFRGLVKPMGAKWATIFSLDLLTSAQARGLTLDQQVQNASLAWSDFQGGRLPGLIQAILDIDAARSATGSNSVSS
jgi:hypothetical protein